MELVDGAPILVLADYAEDCKDPLPRSLASVNILTQERDQQPFGLGVSLAANAVTSPAFASDEFVEIGCGVGVNCAETWDWVKENMLPSASDAREEQERRRELQAMSKKERREAEERAAAEAEAGLVPKPRQQCSLSQLDAGLAGSVEYTLPLAAQRFEFHQALLKDESKRDVIHAASPIFREKTVTGCSSRVPQPFANAYWNMHVLWKEQFKLGKAMEQAKGNGNADADADADAGADAGQLAEGDDKGSIVQVQG